MPPLPIVCVCTDFACADLNICETGRRKPGQYDFCNGNAPEVFSDVNVFPLASPLKWAADVALSKDKCLGTTTRPRSIGSGNSCNGDRNTPVPEESIRADADI